MDIPTAEYEATIYDESDMTDEEWEEIEQMRKDGRGQLTIEPKQLPIRP